MALVDYSDSESDPEPVQQPPSKAAQTASSSTTNKKPFQKLIDRSGPGAGKILVSLPTATADADDSKDAQEPPAKRAKIAGSSSRFSAFGSFLPAPKKNNLPAHTKSASRGSAPGPGVHLRTAAEPAFVRRAPGDDDNNEDGDGGESGSSVFNLPAPRKAATGPTIPEGQKPEHEVKLVGKPLMFKPLSVTRKPAKKKGSVAARAAVAGAPTTAQVPTGADVPPPPPPKKKKKVSLFSMDDGDGLPKALAAETESSSGGAYEPLFSTDQSTEGATGHDGYDDDTGVTGDYESYAPPPTHDNLNPTPQFHSASSIVDGMQLSEKAQRELFGRRGGAGNKSSNDFAIPANARVLKFDMEQEYEHNEALRASGEQVYNPVRSIAPGKHSLRQMVNMAQNNQSALEDSFVQGKNNRKDAAGRYGWK